MIISDETLAKLRAAYDAQLKEHLREPLPPHKYMSAGYETPRQKAMWNRVLEWSPFVKAFLARAARRAKRKAKK